MKKNVVYERTVFNSRSQCEVGAAADFITAPWKVIVVLGSQNSQVLPRHKSKRYRDSNKCTGKAGQRDNPPKSRHTSWTSEAAAGYRGIMQATVAYNGKSVLASLYVTKDLDEPLPGLDLIKHFGILCRVSRAGAEPCLDLASEFSEVFQGFGEHPTLAKSS